MNSDAFVDDISSPADPLDSHFATRICGVSIPFFHWRLDISLWRTEAEGRPGERPLGYELGIHWWDMRGEGSG